MKTRKPLPMTLFLNDLCGYLCLIYADSVLALAITGWNIFTSARIIGVFYYWFLVVSCRCMVCCIACSALSIDPPLFRLLQNKYRGLIAILLIVVLVIVCMLPIEQFRGVTHEVLSNLQWAFGRVPSFIIGMALAPLVKNDVKFNAVLLIVLPLVVYVLIHEFIDKDTPSQWCLVLPVMIVLTFFLKWMKETGFVYRFISWMGIVSLESYLANIYLCQALKTTVQPLRDSSPLFSGGYLEYTIVIFGGILLAWIVNEVSKKVAENIKITS